MPLTIQENGHVSYRELKMSAINQDSYDMWLKETIKPFAKKHHMSLKSVASLIARDHNLTGITYRELFNWVSTESYAEKLIAEEGGLDNNPILESRI